MGGRRFYEKRLMKKYCGAVLGYESRRSAKLNQKNYGGEIL